MGQGYTVNGQTELETGVSISELLGQLPTPLPEGGIESATFVLAGFPDPRKLSGSAHDLDPPAAAGDAYPFLDNLPPVFNPYTTGADHVFTFAVQSRKPGFADPSLTSGRSSFTSPSTPMTLTLQLRANVKTVTLTPSPASVEVGQTVTFTAEEIDPEPGETPHWTWEFGDGQTADTGTSATVTHRYAKDVKADYPVRAHLTGDRGSSGLGATVVHVDGSTPPPTQTTSPPPGESHGPGDSQAPTVGPQIGDGPRVGGVVTGRGGTGSAGASNAPGSASATASPTAVGTDAQVPGTVVGYLLSDATAAAVPRKPAPKALDDSAPAARDGVQSWRIGGWLLGGAAVVVLLALGAGSERRRPLRGRRR